MEIREKTPIKIGVFRLFSQAELAFLCFYKSLRTKRKRSAAIRLRNKAIFNSKIATSDFVLLAMTAAR